jgi:hypothetical protein
MVLLPLILEIESKYLHSAVSQHDSSVTGTMTSFKDYLSDSEFEMDHGNMESTFLYLNDEDEMLNCQSKLVEVAVSSLFSCKEDLFNGFNSI